MKFTKHVWSWMIRIFSVPTTNLHVWRLNDYDLIFWTAITTEKDQPYRENATNLPQKQTVRDQEDNQLMGKICIRQNTSTLNQCWLKKIIVMHLERMLSQQMNNSESSLQFSRLALKCWLRHFHMSSETISS